MNPLLKNVAKAVLQQTVGRLPAPSSRLTGPLEANGGKPVRDLRLRPWAKYHARNSSMWLSSVRPAFRKVFVGGVEGVPQPVARQFAQQWAEYCGCRYGLLLGHG